jgi:XTP/dITP diphosphohydrolase
MTIVLATQNPKKAAEIRALLDLPGLNWKWPADFPEAPQVVEDGETFEANAVRKARVWAEATGDWALADDSGLEVDVLCGEPGVRSSRYAGENADDAANIRKLLLEMEGETDRQARFHCVLALAAPDGRVWTVEGRCDGRISTEPRGSNGFGYDPVFVPYGADKTFGEMSPEEKNRFSHRARALHAAREQWADLLCGGRPSS